MHKRVQVSGFITTYQLLEATGRDAKQAAAEVVTALGGTAPVVPPPASAPRSAPRPTPARVPSADSHIVDISGMWEYQGDNWRAEWIFTQVGTAGTGVFKSGPAAKGVWTSRPEFEASGSGQLVGRQMKLATTFSKTRNSADTKEEQMTVLGPDELESRSPSSTVVYRRVRTGR
jgi:hypothetical protein